jgi:hypothetical protein
MDLALETLPVVTATVLATCAEAWVTADMMIFDDRVCDYAASFERRRDRDRGARAATDRGVFFVVIFACV